MESIRVEARGPIGWLWLARPHRANAYTRAMLQGLWEGASSLSERCQVIVIAAEGASFCAGADRAEQAQAHPLDALHLYAQRVFEAIHRLPTPTIACLQGPAVGGGAELALACDFRLASPAARIWFPETSLGLVPAAGGVTRLTRLLGGARARELILLGRELGAEEALASGLVSAVVPALESAASEMANTLVRRDFAAIRLARELIDLAEGPAPLTGERAVEAMLYQKRGKTQEGGPGSV